MGIPLRVHALECQAHLVQDGFDLVRGQFAAFYTPKHFVVVDEVGLEEFEHEDKVALVNEALFEGDDCGGGCEPLKGIQLHVLTGLVCFVGLLHYLEGAALASLQVGGLEHVGVRTIP